MATGQYWSEGLVVLMMITMALGDAMVLPLDESPRLIHSIVEDHTSAAATDTCAAIGQYCYSNDACCTRVCDYGITRPNVCTCAYPFSPGHVCHSNGECCPGYSTCTSFNVCGCRSLDAICNVDTDCCGSNTFCSNGLCSNCRRLNDTCTVDGDCCYSSRCTDSRCVSCPTERQPCTLNSDCCPSLYCIPSANQSQAYCL